MIVRPVNSSDWEQFFELANGENWRVPQFELQLFQGPWARYAHVIDDHGFCGLGTAIAYQNSAWIGNLIVPPQKRGRGYGGTLFKAMLAELVGQGIRSIWLTASLQGQPIYQRAGFVEVARIERWVLPASSDVTGVSDQGPSPVEVLFREDQRAWGENRQQLLSVLAGHGRIFSDKSGTALLQVWSDLQIIGPWYAKSPDLDQSSKLLEMMVAQANPAAELVLDVFAARGLGTLLLGAGFGLTGEVALMVYGDRCGIDLESMLSLASLGSIG